MIFKAKHKGKASFLSIYFLSTLLISSCSPTPENEETVLTIAVSSSSQESFNIVKREYEKLNKNCTLNLEIYEPNDIYYRLKHNAIDVDLYAVDSAYCLYIFKDKLVNMNQFEEVNLFNISVINSLYDNEGNIYSLPSPGSISSYFMNREIFNKYNFSFPNTISDLVQIAEQFSTWIQPFGTTYAENLYLIDAFIQIAVGSFFQTTQGENFFKDLYLKKASIENSEYKNTFIKIFNTFSRLFNLDFFDINHTNEKAKSNLDKFLDGEIAMISLSRSIDITSLDYNNKDDKFVLYPYLGSNSFSKFVTTSPDFYFAIDKNAYRDKKKKETISDLLSYLCATEGQDILIQNENGTHYNNRISFLKTFRNTFEGPFNEIKDVINSGAYYLTDNLKSVFLPYTSDFKEYVYDEISTNELIHHIDSKISKNFENGYEVYKINSLGFSNFSKLSDAEIVFKIAEDFRKFSKSDIFILPNSFLKNRLYEYKFTEYEINHIFNENILESKISISGEDLINFIQYLETKNILSEFSLSGCKIIEIGNEKNYYFSNGRKIENDKLYEVVLPNVELFDFNLIDTSKVSNVRPIDLLSNYKEEVLWRKK